MADIDAPPLGVARPDPAVVRAAGELDVSSEGFCRALADAVGAAPRGVVVDLLDVTFIDSSVVNALVLACQRAESAGGWVRVVYTHHLIRRVIEICGLSDLLPQYATVAAAVRGTASPPPQSER